MVRLTERQFDRLRAYVEQRARPGTDQSDVVRMAIEAFLEERGA